MAGKAWFFGGVSVNYADSIEDAAAFAKQALDLLDEHKVPATPQNFTVWYAYVSGRYPDLVSMLDKLIESDTDFAVDQHGEIYDKFFSNRKEEEALQDASEQIDVQLDGLMDIINEASGEAKDFQDSIQDGLQGLGKTKGLDGITQIMQTLVSQSKKMQATNNDLQKKLETSSGEIKNLKQHLDDVQKEALTDGLTGIANRKHFDNALRRMTSEAGETGKTFCLLITDIDHFKAFNDNYGHQIGDQVIKLVASILDKTAEEDQLACRYGGEEFALLLPSTELDKAYTIAESIRETVATKRIRNRNTGEEMGNITLSIGLGIYRDGEPVTDLIQRADASLYFAKGNGRNQTATENDIDSPAMAS